MHRRFLLVCTVAVVAAVGVAPAGAKVEEREHYSGTDVFTDDTCGYPLDVVVSFFGHLVIREHKSGQAFLGKDTYNFRAVFSNPENGEFFVIRGHGTFNEIKATLVEGTIYEFTANDAGQPFILEDSDGNVIIRDRGLVRTTYLFDTLGDGEPGGEFIEETSVELRGPHPGFDADLCPIVDELVGT